MRALSIILDDEAKQITIHGWHLFSFLELYGIAEHINVQARLADIRAMDARLADIRAMDRADKEEAEEALADRPEGASEGKAKK